MNDHSIRELVDSYLRGQISAENKKRLQSLMEADPAVEQYIREAEAAYRILLIAQERELRVKMKGWDKDEEDPNKKNPKGMFILIGLLMSALSCWMWLHHHYASDVLAERWFEKARVIGVNAVCNANWDKGVMAFRQQEFEKAIQYFDLVRSETINQINEQATWNILLCQLALSGPSLTWKQALENFSEHAALPFRIEAKALLHSVRSPVYGLISGRGIHRGLTSIKPRII